MIAGDGLRIEVLEHSAPEKLSDDERLWLYNCRDILNQMRVGLGVRQDVARADTRQQLKHDLELSPIIAEVNQIGMPVDLKVRAELMHKVATIQEKYLHELRQIVKKARKGDEDFNASKRKKEERLFNPNSSSQVARYLFVDRQLEPQLNNKGNIWEEGDGWSTSESALLAIDDMPGVDRLDRLFIDRLLRFKGASKVLGTYFSEDFLREDARLAKHPDLKTLFTRYNLLPISGRWASSPNVQNWPKIGIINTRSMLVAPPGHVIVSGDKAQIEARIFAIMSDDRITVDAFLEGIDIHTLNYATLMTETEAKMWEEYHRVLAMPKMEKEKRRLLAKGYCYLEQFGGEVAKLYKMLRHNRDKVTNERPFRNKTLSDIEMCHNNWHRAHPGTKTYQEKVKKLVRRQGFIREEYSGRIRHFPFGPSKMNEPVNHTIQGASAGMMNAATKAIADAIPFRKWSPWTGIFGQTHDWVGVFVPEEKEKEAVGILEEALSETWRGMPFPTDITVTRDVGSAG